MRKSDDFPVAEYDEQDGPPGEHEELVDDEAESEEAVAEKLQIFGARLAATRDEWVSARAAQGHDKRWAEDLDQYNGRDSANRAGAEMMTSVEQGFPVTTNKAKPMRSTVFVQVTRQKTNALAARWQDIAAPNDERNFAVSPTPVPGLPSFVQLPAAGAPGAAQAPGAPSPAGGATPDGAPPIGGPQPAAGGMPAPVGAGAPSAEGAAPQLTPVSAGVQQLLDEQAEAKLRADRMQQEIADDFDQCDMTAEQRKIMFDAALFGAGVIKGPCVINRTRKAWTKRVDGMGNVTWSLEVLKELKPASFRIDSRYFFPDPQCGENVQNGRGAFELDKKTKKGVRDLGKQPGYIKSQLLKVLEQGPTTGKARSIVGDQDERDLVPGDLYEHWYYWGEVEREDLIAAGVEVSEDELEVFSACIEMINSTVVRAYLNPLADGALPYDVVPCERIPGSVWGYGVPYLMRAQQRVINAAWRMILDNAGISSGPQIVMKPGAIRPADGQNVLTARKIWYANDDVEDVRTAFTTFEFASHQAELAAIIDMADRLSDQETAVPMLAQGQQGSAPETVGGMQILMQGANVMLRRLVKQFDDYLIKPHVRRYYDYHMEYSEKEDLKGDFMVVALGSSTLVVRDIQNQAYQQLLTISQQPPYASLVNHKKLFVKALEGWHLGQADVMNTDKEIQDAAQRAAQQQQPDPRVVAAEKRAESDQARTQAQLAMSRETNETKKAIADATLALQERIAMLENENQGLKLQQADRQSLEGHRVTLATTAIKERAKADMQANEISLAASKGEGI